MGKTVLKKFGGLAVVILIAVGWFAFDSIRAKSGAPDVGECVTIGGSQNDADVDEADCGEDDVLYKVLGDDGDCDETELNYTVELKGTNPVDLCLGYDVEVGDCIKFTDLTSPDEKVACADTKGADKVAKVVAVEADAAAACPKESEPVPNVKRGSTICLAANA